VKTNCKKLQR